MDSAITLALHGVAVAQPWLSGLGPRPKTSAVIRALGNACLKKFGRLRLGRKRGLSAELLAVLLADYGVLVLPLALIAVWFAAGSDRPPRRRAAAAGVVSALLAIALGLVLERVLARPRPFVELGIAPLVPHVVDSSFPSDHTLFGVAHAGPLAARVPRVGLWLLAWALLVGVARIMSLLHYPSDILGSAILAFIIDAIGWPIAGRVLAALKSRWVA